MTLPPTTAATTPAAAADAVPPVVAAPRITTHMGLFEWLMLVACAVCWGSAYIFNKIAIAELPPLTITAARLVIAALFLLAICRVTATPVPPFGRAWRPFFAYTLVSNVVPFLLVLRGQRETASGLAAVIGAATPLFVMLLAHFWTTDEKLHGRKVVGVLLGLVGVAIVMGTDALSLSGSMIAKFALLGACLLYAIGALFARRLVSYPPFTLAAMQMTAGSIVSVPLALLVEQPWTLPQPSAGPVAAVIATGFVGSALAAVTYFHVLRRAGATNAMLVTLLVPVTPVLVGALVMGEHLLAREIVGGLVIAFALLVIDGRLFSRFRRSDRDPTL